MKRREFLHRAAYAAGAVWLDPKTAAKQTFPLPAQAGKFSASDTVRLGSTGIQTSRLAMGTGTVGSGHHSHQTALGIKGLADLLLNGYDHGLRFFDTADSYGSHPHVAEALKRVTREMRSNGHAIVGMKILGQGELRNRQDEALRYALSLDLLDAFTIGAESKFEQEDLVRRIAQA